MEHFVKREKDTDRRKCMRRKLGIDLGTNSAGWAVLEDDNIKRCGVLIFEQGIPMEKGVESKMSPAAVRRAARAARRLKFRRRLRKYHVLKILIENGMCPLEMPELKNWISRGKFPLENRNFIAWLNSTCESNPYYFRARAASEKISPFELGRALFHIAIRRGFKSSLEDRKADEKETGQLKGKISDLKKFLDTSGQTLGQFLYEHFKKGIRFRSEVKCGREEHYIPEFNRICEVQNLSAELREKLYTALFKQRPLRSQKHLVGKCMLEKRCNRCLTAHPLFERYRMLAFINSIRVTTEGSSTPRFLNEKERLALRSQFLYKGPTFKFERLRKFLIRKFFSKQSLTFNYRDDHTVGSSSLTHQLQSILQCEDLFTWKRAYIDRRGTERIMDVQTLFDGIKYFSTNYDEEDDSFFRFARERVGLPEESAVKLTQIKISDGYARYSLKALRKIVPFLEEGFIEPYAVYLAKVPELFEAGLYEANKDEIIADFQECVKNYMWEKENLEGGDSVRILPLSTRFGQILEDKWNIPPADIAKLYSFQEPSNYKDCSGEGRLPRVEMGMIFNPMAHRSLTVLRHLVNTLRNEGLIDGDTEIHIELAREVNDKNRRMAYLEYQKQNEVERERAVKAFRERNIIPTEEQILRWRLWEEQKHICLYTGRTIEANEIFLINDPRSGDSQPTFEREHTIPRSVGGDNSMENLTLCERRYNREIKNNRLPTDCPNYRMPAAGYENSIIDNLKLAGFYQNLEEAEKRYKVLCDKARSAPLIQRSNARQKALLQLFNLNYWRNKIRTFEMQRDEVGEFSRRQLAATGVMTRHALQFLKSVYGRVYANSGRVTAFARQAWGLQGQYESKDRSDHVHHAIDAIVAAALDRNTFARIGAAFHEYESNGECDRTVLKIAYPWESFPADVHAAIESIAINHLTRHNEMKQTKRNAVRLVSPVTSADGRVIRLVRSSGDTVRGALHDDTYYGCIMDSAGERRFVLRIPFTSDYFPSMAHFDSIVDKGVREAVKAQMQAYLDSGLNFKDAMSHEFRMKTRTGVFDGPVIRHLRVFRPDVKNPICVKKQTFLSKKEYKQNYYATTSKGGNFMVALYRPSGAAPGDRKYRYEMISLWDWAHDHRQPDYIPPQKRTENGDFIGFIRPGVLVLFYKDSLEELKSMSPAGLQNRLYKVTEFKKDGRICLRWHREARAKKDAAAAMKKEFGWEESSKLPFDNTYPLLTLSAKSYQNHALFAGIDFEITIDGQIRFKE